jgi:hypothetical protein
VLHWGLSDVTFLQWYSVVPSSSGAMQYKYTKSFFLGCLTLKMKVLQYSETSGNARPTIRRHVADDMNPQLHLSDDVIYLRVIYFVCKIHVMTRDI